MVGRPIDSARDGFFPSRCMGCGRKTSRASPRSAGCRSDAELAADLPCIGPARHLLRALGPRLFCGRAQGARSSENPTGSSGARLEEVRICFGKDFSVRDCAWVTRRTCQRESIAMPAARGLRVYNGFEPARTIKMRTMRITLEHKLADAVPRPPCGVRIK